MYKFVVLSLLVLGCSALPSTFRYGNNYGSQLRYGNSYSLAPQQSYQVLGGYQQPGLLSSGFLGSGYGLSSGYGLGLGSLRSGYGLGYGSSYGSGLLAGNLQTVAATPVISAIAAPVASQVIASPVISAVSAPVSTIALNRQANYGLLNVQQGQQFQQVVPAAVQQVARTVEYRALPYQEQPINPQVIEVEPSDNPVHLHFKSRSSSLGLSQSHTPAAPQETQVAASQDEPSRLITEVQKPVIQEVREVISPYRQVTQEINPVQESLHTVVTKGEGQRQQYVAQNNYASYAAPAIAQVAQIQPAAQIAVASPVQAQIAVAPVSAQIVAAPAYQTSSYQLAAPALQTASYQLAAPAYQTSSYQLAAPALSSYQVAAPALTSSYQIQPAIQTSYSSSPSFSSSSFQSASNLLSKPLGSSSFSSSSSSGY